MDLEIDVGGLLIVAGGAEARARDEVSAVLIVGIGDDGGGIDMEGDGRDGVGGVEGEGGGVDVGLGGTGGGGGEGEGGVCGIRAGVM